MSIFSSTDIKHFNDEHASLSAWRKRRREETENELAEINKKMDELEKLQIKLAKQARRKKKIICTRKYEEENPLIYLLDHNLSGTSFCDLTHIIKIILSYLTVDYCHDHISFFPRRVGCLACNNGAYGKGCSYSPYGPFSISRTGKKIKFYFSLAYNYDVVKFHHEEDIMFINYVSAKLELKSEVNKDEFMAATDLDPGLYFPKTYTMPTKNELSWKTGKYKLIFESPLKQDDKGYNEYYVPKLVDISIDGW